MSTSYSAHLICGFKLDKREVMKEVTKYNRDTGKPHPTYEHSYDEYFIDGTSIGNTLDNPDEFYPGECFEGLEVFMDGYDDGELFLGLSEKRITDDSRVMSHEISMKVPPLVMSFSMNFAVEPKHFMFMTIG
jgi:hypothetical protein